MAPRSRSSISLALGVLTTTAIGASVQLLPVATRRTLHAVWPVKLVFWLTVPGMIALIAGMYTAQMNILVPAAVIVGARLTAVRRASCRQSAPRQ